MNRLIANCFTFELHRMVFARCLELRNAGIEMANARAMTLMTISNSISEKPERLMIVNFTAVTEDGQYRSKVCYYIEKGEGRFSAFPDKLNS